MDNQIEGLPPGAVVGPPLLKAQSTPKTAQGVEGLPPGATVGPPLTAQHVSKQQNIEGLPPGATVGPPLRSQNTAQAAQPRLSTWDIAKGVGSHIYHSFADAPTEEDKAPYVEDEKAHGEAPGTQTSGLKRIGLGVKRLFAAEEDTGQRYEQGLVSGAGKLLNAGIEAGKDFLSYATSPRPLLISDDKHGESLFHKYITAPAEAEKQKAVTAPTASESIGHSVAEAIPLIGPIAANLGEKAGTGDVAGAAGEATTYAVAPKVIEEAPNVFKRIPIIRDIPKALADAAEDRKATGKAAAHRAVVDELVKQAIDKPRLFPGTNSSLIRIPDIEGAVERAGKIERNPIAYPLGMRLGKVIEETGPWSKAKVEPTEIPYETAEESAEAKTTPGLKKIALPGEQKVPTEDITAPAMRPLGIKAKPSMGATASEPALVGNDYVEPLIKASPKAASVEAKIEGPGFKKMVDDVGEQVRLATRGSEPLKRDVPLREQNLIPEKPVEPAESTEKLSSRPDKAMLQKNGATEGEMSKILPLTRVELSKLADHFGADLGDKGISRGKGELKAGTHIPREEVFQRILNTGAKPSDIAKAIDEGKHFPGTVSGGSQGAEGEGRGKRVSQRKPTAVKSTEDALHGDLRIGMDAIKDADVDKPGFTEKMAQIVSKYPGLRGIDLKDIKANPERVLNNFVDHLSDNLVWLHDQIPEHISTISKRWYESAHSLTKQWAAPYDIAHEQMAGTVAALSPQNEWNNNVAVARRVADIYKNQQNFKWTPEMGQNMERILSKNPQLQPYADAIRNKSLNRLEEPNEKSLWIRLYDEAHNPRPHENYAPDGSVRGLARTPTGNALATTKWGSLGAISKALSMIEDGSKENIHEMLGDQHKVRSFYNNIIEPFSKSGDVTIDTHAVGAAHLRPMGGSSEEVLHNFGGEGAPSSTVIGTNGTYGLYAEAYRRAASKLGILPRELQSITWEGIRSLFQPHLKTQALKDSVTQIWKDYQNGKISRGQARQRIVKTAGGFSNPKWLSDIGLHEEERNPVNQGKLPSSGLYRAKSSAGGGTGSRSTAAIPQKVKR